MQFGGSRPPFECTHFRHALTTAQPCPQAAIWSSSSRKGHSHPSPREGGTGRAKYPDALEGDPGARRWVTQWVKQKRRESSPESHRILTFTHKLSIHETNAY